MNNIEKKLDALIDALGFDVEENRMPVGDMEISDWNNKLTKRNTVKEKQKVWIICPLCEGTGSFERHKAAGKCPKCAGAGKVSSNE
tara:strand:+ start:113 stop:370 length:258 start_codon:yes stop_codon:yes gene_type:complete